MLQPTAVFFLACQIVQDIEEFVSGEVDGDSPFAEPEFCIPGYGGKDVFLALDAKEMLQKNVNVHSTWGKRSQEEFNKCCFAIKQYILDNLSKEQLLFMGMLIDKDRILRCCLTWRIVTNKDVEHWLCKVYIYGQYARGGRSHGIKEMSKPHCWPPFDRTTVSIDKYTGILEKEFTFSTENIFDHLEKFLEQLQAPFD